MPRPVTTNVVPAGLAPDVEPDAAGVVGVLSNICGRRSPRPMAMDQAIELATAELASRAYVLVAVVIVSIPLALLGVAGVHDAILDYLRGPQSFDPSRARLDTFIGLAARRNLIDRLRRLRRIADRELAGSHPLRSDIAHVLPDAWSDRSHVSIVAAVTRSAPERAFLESRLDGERRTAILARILGAADAPVPEQRRTVKRMADRIRLRLKRLDDVV